MNENQQSKIKIQDLLSDFPSFLVGLFFGERGILNDKPLNKDESY